MSLGGQPRASPTKPTPRHAEILVRDMGVTGPAVKTPGAKVERRGAAEDEDPGEALLDERTVRMYRSGTARANYLAMDRPDLAFATKELCRRMAAPRVQDWVALERLTRYLAAEPRLVLPLIHISEPTRPY